MTLIRKSSATFTITAEKSQQTDGKKEIRRREERKIHCTFSAHKRKIMQPMYIKPLLGRHNLIGKGESEIVNTVK